ncbi:UNVERIFIED_CONTAM: hypothetical protein Slati_2398700 [Sesamum latifolium]|uniref:Integrase catalytic domain-containing protein n=1 Tax=Sesamum latifolium TaxID=2727402 RepID=A0AAW2WFM9_9LAMI
MYVVVMKVLLIADSFTSRDSLRRQTPSGVWTPPCAINPKGSGFHWASSLLGSSFMGHVRRVYANREGLKIREVWASGPLILGHISKDMIRKLVDLKSLEVDDLDNLPTSESYLKGKITKKPFVRQSALANGLLDLIHTDVCGSLNTPARGGYSYFITFTDDHSWYDYIYLIRYKSEAFRRFKEYKLEVENQTGRKMKALQLDRGREYLSGEFIDYLKENGIFSSVDSF